MNVVIATVLGSHIVTTMTNAFIKKTVLNILGQETHFTAEQFVRNWNVAGQVIQALVDMDYRVDVEKSYDGEFLVTAARYNYQEPDVDFILDSAFAQDEMITRGFMVLLVKVNAS